MPIRSLLLVLLCGGVAFAAEPSDVRVSADGTRFVRGANAAAFVPWGFNYDHDAAGRLLEDYWHQEWPTVEQDFAEMRALGANVVRVHLQLGKFLPTPNQPAVRELDRLGRLLELAERNGLLLDITGLGCYHAADAPAWYAEASEVERWAAQERFWEAVAARCHGSPAVFCYDLMNEPVVPGAMQTDWLAGAFAGKHFVQFLTRDPAGRSRDQIAAAWLRRMTAAVRRHDPDGLVTVGQIPGSAARPGAFLGLTPQAAAKELDFLAVHLYPVSGKPDEALATLAAWRAGVPIVVEEMFPLHCTPAEFDAFLDGSAPPTAGWIGFYWGVTPAELEQSQDVGPRLTLTWLERFRRGPPRVVRRPVEADR